MFVQARVVGGQYVNAMIDLNRKGELALSLGFKRIPNLTPDAVASWEEVFPEERGAAGAARNIGQVVARVALPGSLGKAASAAVSSTVDAVKGVSRTVRVDWADGMQSIIVLPEKFFQHLALVLKDRRIESSRPAPAPEPPMPGVLPVPGVIGQIGQIAQLAGVVPSSQPDVTEQIAKLAVLRDQGVLTEAEFSAKKTELLGRI